MDSEPNGGNTDSIIKTYLPEFRGIEDVNIVRGTLTDHARRIEALLTNPINTSRRTGVRGFTDGSSPSPGGLPYESVEYGPHGIDSQSYMEEDLLELYEEIPKDWYAIRERTNYAEGLEELRKMLIQKHLEEYKRKLNLLLSQHPNITSDSRIQMAQEYPDRVNNKLALREIWRLRPTLTEEEINRIIKSTTETFDEEVTAPIPDTTSQLNHYTNTPDKYRYIALAQRVVDGFLSLQPSLPQDHPWKFALISVPHTTETAISQKMESVRASLIDIHMKTHDAPDKYREFCHTLITIFNKGSEAGLTTPAITSIDELQRYFDILRRKILEDNEQFAKDNQPTPNTQTQIDTLTNTQPEFATEDWLNTAIDALAAACPVCRNQLKKHPCNDGPWADIRTCLEDHQGIKRFRKFEASVRRGEQSPICAWAITDEGLDSEGNQKGKLVAVIVLTNETGSHRFFGTSEFGHRHGLVTVPHTSIAKQIELPEPPFTLGKTVITGIWDGKPPKKSLIIKKINFNPIPKQ
jgi:hypothetical protein